MNKIKIKPVSKEFWLLHKDNKKIGLVIRTPNGYSVKINGQNIKEYPSIKTLKASDLFEFPTPPTPSIKVNQVHGYNTDKTPFNPVWNLQFKLPLFTYSEDSKSWYAAGYYTMVVDNKETVEFCPKLITLQRNNYKGPFKEKPILMIDRLIKWG